jgi:hypothetical protein
MNWRDGLNGAVAEMRKMGTPRRFLLAGAAILAAVTPLLRVTPASAVILYRSATANTAAPTGDLANAGWQYGGQFASFMGTPVSSQFFLTAQHIGGASTILYNGVTYNIDQSYNVGGAGNGPGYVSEPGTDLRLWKITGTFPTYAPLYNTAVDGSEIGRNMLVVGRGTERGDPVYGETSQDTGSSSGRSGELKGWLWGADTRVQSWGTNIVSGVFDSGSPYGSLLYFDFDRDGTRDEGAISIGDSGGPVFVQASDGTYKLAGINLGVDGPWRYSPPDSSDPGSGGTGAFNASLFDAGGMYILADANGDYQYIPDSDSDIASSSYASDVSSNLSWIEQYIGASIYSTPEPGTCLIGAALGFTMIRRRR